MNENKMTPDTNESRPVVVKRKKKITQNKNCFASHYEYVTTAHVNGLNLTNVSYYPVANPSNAQQLSSSPFFATSCENQMSNLNLQKNLDVSKFEENPEYFSLPSDHLHWNDACTKRRYSDPGLQKDSDSSTNSLDERVIHKLKTQLTALKENNSRLSKEISELKKEVNVLQQQNNNKYYNREYEPGKLADIIREVRDAARMREEAFFARVKHFMEEQQQQIRLNQIHFLSDKQKDCDRILKLEEQLKNLHILFTRLENNNHSMTAANGNNTNSTRQVLELEREALELRRELQETRAKKEESDQRLVLLDKKVLDLINRYETNNSGASDDGKTGSIESLSLSISTNASSVSKANSRISLTGPVTDL